MGFQPKSRRQKLVDALYPFFGQIALKVNDNHALLTCRHLRALNKGAIEDTYITPFTSMWTSEHPDEMPLTNDELLWALELLDEHIAKQLKKLEFDRIRAGSPDAKMRVINGGLSKNPAIPYVDMDSVVHEYPDF